jgi:nitrogen fixation NifU-like protein
MALVGDIKMTESIENIKYSKKVMKYFTHPKNVGEIKDADGVGKVGNITCGDIMHVYIKIGKKKIKGKEKEFIEDIKFRTLGCAAAIATSSMITTLAKGKELQEAIKLSNEDVVKALGGLPPIKHHCSLLAEEALSEAIYDYLKKNKRQIPSELERKHKRALTAEKEFETKFKK